MDKKYTYKIKCRQCIKITEMFHSSSDHIKDMDFLLWVSEHSKFPVQHKCDCDEFSVMLHDIVSYKILF